MDEAERNPYASEAVCI